MPCLFTDVVGRPAVGARGSRGIDKAAKRRPMTVAAKAADLRTLFYDSDETDPSYNGFQYWKEILKDVGDEEARKILLREPAERRRIRPIRGRRPRATYGISSEDEEEDESATEDEGLSGVGWSSREEEVEDVSEGAASDLAAPSEAAEDKGVDVAAMGGGGDGDGDDDDEEDRGCGGWLKSTAARLKEEDESEARKEAYEFREVDSFHFKNVVFNTHIIDYGKCWDRLRMAGLADNFLD
jgi:hypothetical protein